MPTDFSQYDSTYYVKSAIAGGICCSLTHAAVCPVDVVKTRIQLQPEVYNRGLLGGFRQVIANEGAGALATGVTATAVGYFVQGWFKFGGVEFFKINAASYLGEEGAWNNRTKIYLGAAAGAEFIADCFLTPLEATRIRQVNDPAIGSSLMSAAGNIMKQDGLIKGFYSGFVPVLFKQIPYTMAKFAVQGLAAEQIANSSGIDLASPATSNMTKTGVALSSGVIAGVAAAIISHPADTLLSLMNKPGRGGDGGIASRLVNIAKEEGFYNLQFKGLGARCVMIGTLTAGQFAIFDNVMAAVGAKKFHFHAPGH